jgi:hypothetical protein
MSELMPADAGPEEYPWNAVDTLLGWRRFVLWGIAAAWTVVIVAAVAWPRRYVAEAMVAIPNLMRPEVLAEDLLGRFAEPKRSVSKDQERERVTDPATGEERERERVPKLGISIGTYKKVEGALSDAGLLTEAFQGRRSAKEIARLRQHLRQIVTPVVTGPRDDLVRADREDTVTAVRLWFEDDSAEGAAGVVNTLATLVREAVVTRVIRDKVEAQLLQSTASASAALTKKVDLSAKNESLKMLAQELQRLAASPGGQAAGREVVDVQGGGHRYLPASVQLVGAKAWQADNDHEIRQAEWSFKVASLKVAFYRRLQQKLQSAQAQSELAVTHDVTNIVDAELKAFLEQPKSPAADYLEAEVTGMRDMIEALRVTTVLVQRPSLGTTPRTPWVVGTLAATAVAVLLAALVAASWRRYHRSGAAKA